MDNKLWNKLLKENTLVTEENELSERRIGTLLDKKLKTLDNKIRRYGKRGWNLTLVPGKGTSIQSDDWKTVLDVSIYDNIVEIEIAMVGTDKRGRSDSELLYGTKKKIKTEEDIDKLVNILKGKIKKFSKKS
jgi:hypothetical protein